MTTPPPTEMDRAVIQDHVAANQHAIRSATGAVIRACRGRFRADSLRLGMDHTAPQPLASWWASITVQTGRAGHTLYAEGHTSALAALEELGGKVSAHLRATAGRRR